MGHAGLLSHSESYHGYLGNFIILSKASGSHGSHRLAHRLDRLLQLVLGNSKGDICSILLADDEEKILKRLGRALRDDGHDVVECSNAR